MCPNVTPTQPLFDQQRTTKVAVVLPVYNTARYLRECLDSILAQSHKNFVVFAVDDGSTDTSGQILDEYAAKDQRIVTFHKKNGGVSSARNVALDAIENEGSFDYIAFVDSDDLVKENFLELYVTHLSANCADYAVYAVGSLLIKKGLFGEVANWITYLRRSLTETARFITPTARATGMESKVTPSRIFLRTDAFPRRASKASALTYRCPKAKTRIS